MDWREEKKLLVQSYHEQNKNVIKGQVVFTGSSLMEMFPIDKWISSENCRFTVYNRGVGGYRTDDFLPIVDILVNELEPSKVFINIGTNDLSDGNVTIDELIGRYGMILERINAGSPKAKLYLMAYFPVNFEAASEEMMECLKIRNNDRISKANMAVEKLAGKFGAKYIDVNDNLKDENGNLIAAYTIEGMHIKPEGYRAIFRDVLKFINE